MSTQSATKTLLQLMTVSCFALAASTVHAQTRPDYGPAINAAAAKKIAAGVITVAASAANATVATPA